MKKYLLFVIPFLFFSAVSFSQSAEDSVKATVNRMFAAMKAADAVALQSVIADSAILQTITKNKQGNTVVRSEAMSEFIRVIGSLTAGDADERIRFDMVKIDGDLASVWTPYSFYYKGQFSHCGVNSFQLVRMNNNWKVQYIIDTRRKDGCLP